MRMASWIWVSGFAGVIALGVGVAACSSTNAPVTAVDASTKGDGAPGPSDGGGDASDAGTGGEAGPTPQGDGGGLLCSDAGAPPSTTVTTPFAAPNDQLTFTPPTIPCRMFNITSYGAMGDGTTKNTDAFAQAVAAALAAGGGVVDVPAGNWLTGPIHLESNIELHLESGATVLFSTDYADYGFSSADGGTTSTVPLVPTRWEGLDVMNGSPLVDCLNCTNVAITGTGTLYGQGAAWWSWKSTSAVEDKRIYNAVLTSLGLLDDAGSRTDAGFSGEGGAPLPLPTSGVVNGLRPTMVECNGCTNFLIQDVTIKDGPYWIVHPLYSENVIVRRVHILSGKEPPIDGGAAASNGDGLDPDSCKKVLIEDTDFDTSDDNIAIKSGLNEDGIYVGRPSEEIVVRRITSIAGHGGMTIGSEMSGGVHNVYATGSALTGTGVQYPLRYKTLPGRGGTISDIWYDGITLNGWTSGAIIIDMAYGSSTITPFNPSLLPTVKNITFANLSGPSSTPGTGMCPATATSCPPITLKGQAQSPLQNIVLSNVNLAGTGSTCVSGQGGVQTMNVNVPNVPMNGPWSCP